MEILDGGKRIEALKLSVGQLKALMHPLRLRVLSELATPQYTANIAKKFKLSEQRMYYHVRLLEKAGLIRMVKKESKRGATARLYQATKLAFGIVLQGAKVSKQESEIIDYFMNSLIVVGAPDPHGPYKARARDNYYAADLTLFLGKFSPDISITTDTQLRPDDLEKNLILIGGPVVNTVTEKINPYLKIRFTTENGNVIESTRTGKKYFEDETGLIAVADNPWAAGKKVLVLAGRSWRGTKAAIIGFTRYLREITGPRVVLGVDVDGDGTIDDIEFLE